MKKKKILLVCLAMTFILGVVSACTNNESTSSNSSSGATYEQRYTLTHLAYELEVNEDFSLDFEDGTLVSDVTWTSSDETVATVDASGKVVAKKAGTATIKADSATFWSTCIVTVTDNGVKPLLSLNVQNENVTLTKGDKYAIAATLSYNNKNYEDVTYTYDSSDTAVATVDGTGIVNTLATGTATITVTATWRNGVVVKTDFSVMVKNSVYVTLNKRNVVLYSCNPIGYDFALEDNVTAKLFDGLTEKDVTFTVEEQPISGAETGEVATYADGKIKSVAKGTTQFVFTCEYDGVEYVSDPVLVTVQTPIVRLDKNFEGLYDAEDGVTISLGNIGVDYQLITKLTDQNNREIVFDADNAIAADQISAGEHVWRFYFDNVDVAYEMDVLLASKYLYTTQDFADLDANGYYVLKNDVDFSGSSVNSLFGFNWLGDACLYDLTEGFHGTFDGNGHTISNFVVNSYGGFFGTLGENGVVKNVGFKNCSAVGEAMLLFANVYGGTIENVSVNTTGTVKYAPIGILSVESTIKNVVIYAPNCGSNGLSVMTYNLNTTVENVYVVSNKTEFPGSAYLRSLDNYDLTYFDATAYLSDANFAGIAFNDVFNCGENGAWVFDEDRLLPFIKWVDFYRHDEVQYILNDDKIAFTNEKFNEDMHIQVGAYVIDQSNYTLVGNELTLTKTYLDTIAAGEVIEMNIYVSATEAHVYEVVRPTAVITDLNQISDPNGYYLLGGDIDASGFQYTRFLTLSDGSNYGWYAGDGSNGAATTYQNEGFNGTLDGRGYTIKNIKNVTYGLFAVVGKNGVIKNVHFENFSGGELCTVVASCFFGTLENVSFYSEQEIWGPVALACEGSRFINVVVYTPSATGFALYQQISLSGGTKLENVYAVSAKGLGGVHWGQTIDGYDIHYYASLDNAGLKANDFSKIFEISEDSIWQLDEIGLPRITGEKIVYEYVQVTFMDGTTPLESYEVIKGSILNYTPSAGAGYVYTWTKDGEVFDLTTPITEDITLTVASKSLKPITLTQDSVMEIAGIEYSTANKSYDVELGSETAMMQQAASAPSWTETMAQWKFDVTAEDIAAWMKDGYTKISFKVFASVGSGGGTPYINLYGTTTTLTDQQWKEVELDLTTWAANYDSYFTIYLGAGTYRWIAAITQPQIVSTATVTFTDGTNTLKTVEVNKGATITEVPSAGAGYAYSWKLNGEAFDFATPITEDITLVGTKTLKAITMSEDSRMEIAGIEYSTANKSYDVELGSETAMMQQEASAPSYTSVLVQWKFDVTAEDIAAWMEEGYTKITFKVFARVGNAGGTPEINLYGTTTTLADQQWKEVELDLATWAANYDSYFTIFLGSGTYRWMAAITQPVLS